MCRFATPLRSNVSVAIATVQPWCSGPRSASAGMRTSSKKISQNSASPVAVRSGRTSMPGSVHVDDEARDALVLGRGGVGAGQQLAPLGELAEGVPHLLAVEDPAVAVALGARGERSEVAAGVGLAEALAPDLVAAQHRAQETLLLRVGAVRHDRWGDVGEADGVERARRCLTLL